MRRDCGLISQKVRLNAHLHLVQILHVAFPLFILLSMLISKFLANKSPSNLERIFPFSWKSVTIKHEIHINQPLRGIYHQKVYPSELIAAINVPLWSAAAWAWRLPYLMGTSLAFLPFRWLGFSVVLMPFMGRQSWQLFPDFAFPICKSYIIIMIIKI